MWHVEELFVLSDFHLAAERNAGAFQSDVELAGCLRWILDETRDSLIILAGDILDFLSPGNGHTNTGFDRHGEQTQEIIEHHPEVFDALAQLAHSPKHRLVMMGGDNDPELIFPVVQEAVERRLSLDFARPSICWLVHGEALRLRVGNAVALIEHGNTLDPWNRIDHVTLQHAYALASRNLPDVRAYQPPLGGRLTLEIVNGLRADYQWVACLKPSTESILPLLWHVASPTQRDALFNRADEYLSMKAFAHNKKNSHNPDRLYLGEKESEDSPRDRAFKSWVDAVYEQRQQTPEPAEPDDEMVERLSAVSAQGALFDVEKPDCTGKYLQPVLEGGADLVVHGHTRAAKAYTVGRGFYLNAGTWGQLLRLPQGDRGVEAWRDFLRLLRTNDVKSFRRPTFVRVRQSPTRQATTAALLEWQQSGPSTLTARRFTDRQTGWRRES